MPPDYWQRRKRKKPVSLGRNCTLFETVRWDVYRVARTIGRRNERPTLEDTREFEAAIVDLCQGMHATFSEAMPEPELAATVRSFYRWITNRYTGWTDSRTTSEEKSAAHRQIRRGSPKECRRPANGDQQTAIRHCAQGPPAGPGFIETTMERQD